MPPYSQPPSSPSYVLPIAILLGFGIISGVIFFANASSTSSTPHILDGVYFGGEPTTEVRTSVPEVAEVDFVRGNPTAPIMFVTYIDYNCATCKNYHNSLNSLIRDYGMNGQVAWTQRHMVSPDSHPDSLYIANAAECVGSLGSNRTFWKFADQVFAERELAGTVDLDALPTYATQAGVDADAFATCIEEERYYDYILATTEDAGAAGAVNVPYTIIMTDNEQAGIHGSYTYPVLQAITEELLAQLEDFVDLQMGREQAL